MLHFWTPLPSEELLEHLRAEAVRRYLGYELQLLFRETEAGVRYSFYFKPLAGYELPTAPGFPTYDGSVVHTSAQSGNVGSDWVPAESAGCL